MQKKINNPDVDLFLKAFDLDSKNEESNTEGEEEYANITESEESFDELSSQFKDDSMNIKYDGVSLGNEEDNMEKETTILDAVDKICNDNDNISNDILIENMSKGDNNERYNKQDKRVVNTSDNTNRKDSEIDNKNSDEIKNNSRISETDCEQDKNDDRENDEKIEYDGIDVVEDESKKEENNFFDSEANEEKEKEDNNICNENIENDNNQNKSNVKEKMCVEYDPNFNWSLESPSRIYDNFYKKKMAALCKSLVGGEKINFDRIEREISSYCVDVTSETFDQREVDARMQEAISYRERLVQISVRVNAQYHKFKEEYESLKGVLARVEYLKPAKRQDGLEYEHLWDMHNYLSRLESLHISLSQVDKVLSDVYQMLSRKVSMYMESRVREIYDNNNHSHVYVNEPKHNTPRHNTDRKVENTNKNTNKHIDKNYDQLPSDANIYNNKGKTGLVDWTEL